MTAPLLSLSDVVVRYGRRDAVTVGPCSLSVDAGEIVALVGESGSGKSTLARVAAGLIPATEGELRIDGQRPAALTGKAGRALRRRVQMVFQDPSASLNPHQSVAATIREPMIVRGGWDPAAMDARVEALMAMMGLSASLLTRRPRELSGGQKQRVAIARALAMEPHLLIADEALAALDVVNQLAVASIFSRLRGEGIGMLMISHDLGMVRRIADRIVVIRDGRIVEEGAVADVLTRPAHAYTQSLIEATPDIAQGGLDLSGVETAVPAAMYPGEE